MMHVLHRIPRDDVGLGVVYAEGVRGDVRPPNFEARLERLLADRQAALSGTEEQLRQDVRALLRNGSYHPTGRGKPASEYLLRAAREGGGGPRINAPVDVCNYISLQYVLPVSLWDLDRAASRQYLFRLGRAGETYVFNAGGQAIALEDLIVGCRMTPAGGNGGEPIVNPVKDSLATKTGAATARVAACVYAPLRSVPPARLAAVCETFAQLLSACGPAVTVGHALALPGGECRL